MGLLDNNAYLPPEDEEKFLRDMFFAPGWRDWRRGFERSFGQYPNIDPGGDYNYRAAWKLGAVPEINEADQQYHGFSKAEMPPYAAPVDLKQQGHPTAWKQKFMEKFNADPDMVRNPTPEMQQFMASVIDDELALIPFSGLLNKGGF